MTALAPLAAPSPLVRFVAEAARLLVITGAGVSTDSGIPDYRSPNAPAYKPLTHSEFFASERVRQRYWARSFVGFAAMAHARPNAAHVALASLERLGLARAGLITQNVDRLHRVAGHADVLELHGTIHECECMACKRTCARTDVQAQMQRDNARWAGLSLSPLSATAEELGMLPPAAAPPKRHEQRPDGDVELGSSLDTYSSFVTPTCGGCGEALLKPSVVFHGGTVPEDVAADAAERARSCDAVLVVGSTLSTFSAFRLVRDIGLRKRPVAIINCGATRADAIATLKVEERVGLALPALLRSVKA